MKKTHWQCKHRVHKLTKRKRLVNLHKILPVVKELCKRSSISIRKTDHGYQFCRDEYIVNWSPTTNKVTIQYRLSGHNETILFTKQGEKPRIVIAVQELVDIVGLDSRPKYQN